MGVPCPGDSHSLSSSTECTSFATSLVLLPPPPTQLSEDQQGVLLEVSCATPEPHDIPQIPVPLCLCIRTDGFGETMKPLT